MKQYTVSFIGAGKVAGALCHRFHEAGLKIGTIVSRTPDKGMTLAEECGGNWSPEPRFSGDEDCIFVAVPDDSIRSVMSDIETGGNAVIAHTAGSMGLEVFPGRMEHKGVFYPLQTFSHGRKVEFTGLPFFVEASDKTSLELLTNLAVLIGGSVNLIDEDQRRFLHIAAVFVNNFTNYMLLAGKKVTDHAGLSFSVMEPLIRETVDKAIKNGPEFSQTGPASRDDHGTIEKHINLLSFSPELQEVYKEITRAIVNNHKNTGDDQF